MSKIALFYILSLVLCSYLVGCKKETTITVNPKPSGLDSERTGLILTPKNIYATIPNINQLDTTNFFPVFNSLSVLQLKNATLPFADPFSIPGMAESKKQLHSDCVPYALAYGAMSKIYSSQLEKSIVLSPAFIYNQVNNGVDSGSEIRKCLDFVKASGTCEWEFMPESLLSFIIQPTLLATENAKQFTVSDYYTCDPGNHGYINFFLRNGIPAIVGLTLDEAWYRGKYRKSKDYETTSVGDVIWKSLSNYHSSGYHAVVVCGYSNSLHSYKILNSWGPSFGNNGYIWIDYDVFKNRVSEMYFAFPRIVSTTSALQGGDSLSVQILAKDYGYGHLLITNRGVCYSEVANPTIGKDFNIFYTGKGTEGPFLVEFKNLKRKTLYHLRAFAVAGGNVYYGNEITYLTPNSSLLPDFTIWLGNIFGNGTPDYKFPFKISLSINSNNNARFQFYPGGGDLDFPAKINDARTEITFTAPGDSIYSEDGYFKYPAPFIVTNSTLTGTETFNFISHPEPIYTQTIVWKFARVQ